MTILAAPSIRHACVGGMVVVLDLATESYYVLDEVATSMWEAALASPGLGAAAETVAAAWGQDTEPVRQDLQRFVASNLRRGWLLDESETPPPGSATRAASPVRAHSTPRASAAWAALAATALSLRRKGFRQTYEQCALLPCHGLASRLPAATAAFHTAENFFIARRAPADCLPRSLALFRFLRQCGVPADHVIGVRRVPFRAHAWVEFEGQPILDSRETISGLTPLARLPAVFVK